MQNNAALKTVLFKFQWKASQSDNLPYSNVVFESDLVMNSAMIKPKLYIQLQVETWIGRVKIQPRLEWTHLNDNTDPKNVTTWPTIRIIIHVLSLIAHEYSLNKVWNVGIQMFCVNNSCVQQATTGLKLVLLVHSWVLSLLNSGCGLHLWLLRYQCLSLSAVCFSPAAFKVQWL